MAYTFIISDESINDNNFIVRTSGIRTERFRKNPVMLYMHDRDKGVIGRWENIRVQNTQLLADAVFDENNPLGKEVKTSVDGGFLRSVSIGINVNSHEYIDGTDTVTDCELMEVSIVDIPSNKNAVKLFNRKGTIVLSLKELTTTDKDLRTQLIDILKLSATATDNDIIEAVTALMNADNSESATDKALRLGYIDHTQITILKHMARTDKPAFLKFMQDKEHAATQAIADEVNQALRQGKIIVYERDIFENIGKQLGITALQNVLNAMPEKISFGDFFTRNGSDKLNKSKWELKDYRKYAPQELRDNPELYARLREKEYGTSAEPAYGLAYYRKHRPEYLAQHPDYYEALLARERKNK